MPAQDDIREREMRTLFPAAEAGPEGLYTRLYVEQDSRDGDRRPPYDDRRADVPL
jgi:hypothetical protein